MPDVVRGIERFDDAQKIFLLVSEFLANAGGPWVRAGANMYAHAQQTDLEHRCLETLVDCGRNHAHHGAITMPHERDAMRVDVGPRRQNIHSSPEVDDGLYFGIARRLRALRSPRRID